MEGKTPGAVRGPARSVRLFGHKATTQVAKLSGGERARLALALITRDAPHLLILDEPTNHLDVDAREALVQALNAYEGAVILISHDRHMVELTADRLVLVDEGTAERVRGQHRGLHRLRARAEPDRRRMAAAREPKKDRRADAALTRGGAIRPHTAIASRER
jgi:ATP-binding cassette subfamily F protein 3